MKNVILAIATLLVFIFGDTYLFAQAVAPANNNPTTVTTSGPITIYPDLTNLVSTTQRNLVREYIPQNVITDETLITIGNIAVNSQVGPMPVTTDYFDGLGRPIQNVKRYGAKKPTTIGNNDLVTPYVYDDIGRQRYQYPSYKSTTTGRLKTSPLSDISSKLNVLYPGEHPYSEIRSDNSPLNTTVKELIPGNKFVGSDKGTSYTYEGNTNGNLDKIYKYSIGSTSIATNPTASGSSPFYNVNELYKKHIQDGDGKSYIEFRDKDEKLIAVMQSKSDYYTGTPPNISPVASADYYKHYVITYYVYDDLNRLRFVITPEAYFQAHYPTVTGITTAIADGLCYKYLYDDRGRIIEGKLPGKEKESFVYDKKDHLIFYQDGNLKANGQNKWLYTVYDVFDRTLVTGIYTAASTVTRSNLASNISGSTTYQPTNIRYYMKNDLYQTYPGTISDCEQLTKNSYDFYDAGVQFDNQYNSKLPAWAPQAYLPAHGNQTRGLTMKSEVKVLDPSASVSWLVTKNIYDTYTRLTQQKIKNHKNGEDILTTQHNFGGDIAGEVIVHNNPDAISPDIDYPALHKSTEIINNHQKDYNAGFIFGLQQSINGVGLENVFTIGQDELGRLSNKSFLVSGEEYTYNISGMLTSINASLVDNGSDNEAGPFFGERIFYDQGFGSKYYNGNIAGITWRHFGTGALKRSYGYSYDEFNRLTHAESRQYENSSWTKQNSDFTASSITYDYNGNLKTMNQRGPGSNGPVDMDNLSYQYNTTSNQLKGVSDIAAGQSLTVPDFDDDANHSVNDYTYDANGNLTSDLNKGITSVTYNHLNKPELITTTQGSVKYVYDALGNKLKKIVTPNAGSPSTFDYIGNFEYESNFLKFIYHPEGRYRPFPNATDAGTAAFFKDYFFKDHLGNVRTVINAEISGVGPAIEYANSTSLYRASMEVSLANTESLVWSHLDDVRDNRPLSTDPNDTRAAMLNASDANKTVGTALLLRVMPGDQFSVSGESYYDAVWESPESQVTTGQVVNSLLSALMGGQTYAGVPVESLPENVRTIQNTVGATNFGLSYENILSNNASSNGPRSFLNYIVFDERYNVVASQSGAIRMPATANQWNTVITNGSVRVGQPGYVLFFTNTYTRTPIFWDQIDITFYKGNLLEENHYYPFGLTFSASTANSSQKNNHKLTTKELQDNFGINWYDFGARMQDMQIGRWTSIDPLADNYEDQSPYNYVGNNPVRRIDVDGRSWLDRIVGYTSAVVDNATGFNTKSYFSQPGRYTDAADLNYGMNVGDLTSMIVGSAEMTGGAGTSAGGLGLTYASGGLAVEVSGPMILSGMALTAHGRIVTANAADNYKNQKGRVKETGSYTTNHESGKNYHGKGGEKRAKQSAKEKSEAHNDPVKKIEWKAEKNDREAFKAEAKRIEKDGGVNSENNYNKINSPGKKHIDKDFTNNKE